jgi:signal transduction histidine kinase/ligand-binding sensor domain-containing protein
LINFKISSFVTLNLFKDFKLIQLKYYLIALIILPSILFAQNTNLLFNHFGVSEGLTQGNVTCMMQDHQGLMWFGTWDGLNVYDGFKNTTFREKSFNSDNIRGALINNIIEIDSNRVAVGTYLGLSIFYRNKQKFENYYYKENSENNVRLLKIVDNKLVVLLNNRLMQFNLLTLQFLQIDIYTETKWNALNKNRKFGANRPGHLFSRLFDFLPNANSFQPSLENVFSKYAVNDIYFDAEYKRLYLGCDEGLFYFDLLMNKLSNVLLKTMVKSLHCYNNQLFVGTQKLGLFVYNNANLNLFTNYKFNDLSKQSITGNFIRTMYIDDNQTLWISVLGSGINYCSLKPKIANTIFTYADLPADLKQNNYIKVIAEDLDENLWIATVLGNIWVLNNNNQIVKKISAKDLHPTLLPSSIQSIFINKFNQKFILTEKGLFISEKNNVFIKAKNKIEDESQNYLQSIIALSDSLYLIGSRKGLLLYNSQTNILAPYIEETIQNNTIHFIHQSNERLIYIGSFYKGINIFKFINNKLEPVHSIMLNLNLKSCFETKDSLYFATTKGILFLDKKTFNHSLIGELDGLPNQNIYCLLPDKNNAHAFWCSSNRGIFRYDYKTKKIFTLGLNDGLNSLEFNTNAYASRKNGQYVFGSINGLTVLRPDSIVDHFEKTELIAYNLKFDNLVASDLENLKEGNRYKIPFRSNGFSCRLIQINFPNFESPVRYKLKGHDKTWNTGVNPVEIRYSNLPEGNYEFVAQYYSRKNGWVTKYFFQIYLKPPWFRSWWAFLLYLFFVLGIIVLVSIIYINKKLQKQREILVRKEVLLLERDRISADLHDDVGSTLSSISIYSEAIKNNLKRNETSKALALVSKIGESARETISNLSDIVWSINPINDSGEKVFNRMESFSSSILASKNIQLNFNCDKALSNLEYSIEAKQNIFFIFKEAINNAAKYSHATMVNVTIQQIENDVMLKITDNGKGFQNVKKIDGNGLKNMEHRAKDLNGSFDLISSNNGTTIEVRFPILKQKI